MFTSGIARIFNAGSGIFVDTMAKVSDISDGTVLVGRVTDVCLNTNSALYKGWASIGTISFQEIQKQTPSQLGNKKVPNSAVPLFANNKMYPLVDEFVLLFRGASSNNPQTSNVKQFYYIPLNICK